MRLKILAGVAFCFALAACETPYTGGMGLMGGVKADRIDEHRAYVVAKGNGYTELSTMRAHFLRKAAEMAREAGYAMFEVVDEHAERHSSNYSTGGYASTTFTKHGAFTYYSPPDSFMISRPEMEGEIYMTNEPRPGTPQDRLFIVGDVLKYIPTNNRPAQIAPAVGPTPAPPGSTPEMASRNAEEYEAVMAMARKGDCAAAKNTAGMASNSDLLKRVYQICEKRP